MGVVYDVIIGVELVVEGRKLFDMFEVIEDKRSE